MQRFMFRILPENKLKITVLCCFLFILPLAATLGAVFYVVENVSLYNNKTVKQHELDVVRLNKEYDDACTAEGHFWDGEICIANYTRPNTDWFEPAELNSIRNTLQQMGPLVILFPIVIGFGLVLLVLTYYERRED